MKLLAILLVIAGCLGASPLTGCDAVPIPTDFRVINVTDFGYTLYQFTVTGTRSDTLQFLSYQDDLSGWFLDDVSLDKSGVPEPSSLLLIA